MSFTTVNQRRLVPTDPSTQCSEKTAGSHGKVPQIAVLEGARNNSIAPVFVKPGNADPVQNRLDQLNEELKEIPDPKKLSAAQTKEINLLSRFQEWIMLPAKLPAKDGPQASLADMRRVHGLLRRQKSNICGELKKLYGPKYRNDVLEHVRQSFGKELDALQKNIAMAEQNQQDKAQSVDLHGLIVALEGFQKLVEVRYSAVDPNHVDAKSIKWTFTELVGEVESAIQALRKIDSDDLSSAGEAARLAVDLRKLTGVLGEKVQVLGTDLSGWEKLQQSIEGEVALLDDIVGSSPLTKSKMYQAKQQMVQAAINALKQLEMGAVAETAKPKLLEQILNLEQRREALEAAANNDENRRQLANPADVIGRKPLDSFLDRLFRGHKVEAQRKALNEAITKLMSDKSDDNVEIDLSAFNEQALMEGVLKNVLERVGLARTHDASDLYRRAHSDLLNKDSGSWKEIKVSMSTTTAPPVGSAQSPISTFFTNVIRPAREFGGQLSKLYEEHGLHGINSHCTTEYRHAVNFAKTETLDANGNRIFSGYRAATLSAYQITPEQMHKMPDAEVQKMLNYLRPTEMIGLANPASTILFDDEFENVGINSAQMASLVKRARTDAGFCARLRAEAAYRRAHEIVTGMVQDRLNNEPELVEQIRRGETTIEDMCITSMSLLTPDMINLTGELRMQEEQFKAWERIRQKAADNDLIVKVQLPADESENVPAEWKDVGFKNLQVLTFDFGVNSGAIGNTSWLPGSGGWGFADSHNAKGFEALFGKDRNSGIFKARYDKMMQRYDGLRKEISALENGESGSVDLQKHREKVEELKLLNNQIQAASQLRQQIQQMWADKSYQDAGNEAYKMVSRLAVLGSLLGIQLVFNCKSGKDRTGETDAEAKYIASRIARGLGVHPPNKRLSKEEFRNRQWFVLRSGNHEMQAYNTGLGGYKLSGVDRLYKQFHRYVLTDFLGLSAYTRS